ncbi:hypothetical protein GUJ93_ZPchr0005g15467 [Zizania palustris]|uniref:Uncharacterized protein n=1 Tax=Zizania palustris TaxID=103762 RepID=A0A8J5W0F8_ZIZPA|nr:hypothetical protein GUJ93_ZPchr0005g15467 [Zizania palustris]
MLGLAALPFASPPPRASAAAAAAGGTISLGDGGHFAVPPVEDADKARTEGAHKWRMVIAYDGTKFKV